MSNKPPQQDSATHLSAYEKLQLVFIRAKHLIESEGIGAISARLKFKLSGTKKPFPALISGYGAQQAPAVASIPETDAPQLICIIDARFQNELTQFCLHNLLASLDSLTCKIVVIVANSQSEHSQQLQAITGLTLVELEQSADYYQNCKTLAQTFSGKYLALINNACEIKNGCLQSLIETLNAKPKAGLVSASMLDKNGRLLTVLTEERQEDKSPAQHDITDPYHPENASACRVNTLPELCLLCKRTDFIQLHYPAAGQLARQFSEQGKLVYFQPLARAHYLTNLETCPLVKATDPHQKQVLIMDARVLMPDHDSGSLRMLNIIKVFQRLDYRVTFIADNLQYHERYTPMLQALGVNCFYQPYLQSVNDHLKAYGERYSVIMLSRADLAARHIASVKQYCSKARIIFDTVDLHFLREQRLAELNHDKLLARSAQIRKKQELGLARQADTTLVVSSLELEMIAAENPELNVALLSNIHPLHDPGPAFNERKDILFIGNFEHPPNTDAMHHFLDDIFPLILKKMPELKLYILGGNIPAALAKRANDSIIMPGFVSDIAPWFNSIRLSIAPLRYGAGVKGKLNSSMSFGVPVIASTVAAEGMNLLHEQDVLLADSAEEFAIQTLRAYQDESLWSQLAKGGRQNIEQYFSFGVATRQLQKILE